MKWANLGIFQGFSISKTLDNLYFRLDNDNQVYL